MSIGKLESFLGKHIEGFFNKKFSSSLEFPEVAKQLQREVMHNAVVVLLFQMLISLT